MLKGYYIGSTDKNPILFEYEGLISIGDWSRDGHEHYDIFNYKCNYPVDSQQRAYLHAVELTGLSFDSVRFAHDPNTICTNWKDSAFNAYHIEILRRCAGINGTKFGNHGPFGFRPKSVELAEIILWFISLGLPEFRYSLPSRRGIGAAAPGAWRRQPKEIKNVLNGWGSDLNVQFGYGVFDDDWKTFCIPSRNEVPHLKYYNLTKEAATGRGRIVQHFPYEVRTNNKGYDIEFKEKLRNFRDNWTAGHVLRAGYRFWFTSQEDAVLFKLFVADK